MKSDALDAVRPTFARLGRKDQPCILRSNTNTEKFVFLGKNLNQEMNSERK